MQLNEICYPTVGACIDQLRSTLSVAINVGRFMGWSPYRRQRGADAQSASHRLDAFSMVYVPWPDRLIPQRALFAKSTDVRERLFDIAIGDSFNTLNGECASQLATPIRLSAKMPESMLLARESVVSEALTAKYAATDSAPLTVM